ncbi:protein SET DOMAIN GROUP 41 [Vigna unguiculata]|uniref:protein SET DOMAIN GROUP 41 n=1 Tax=Vigna unguiculata TaxID=3917 RepID=UPI001016FA2B|nr:protein SET DOMAIN GROUP 41 [Vigna unguiculata]
MEMRSSEEIEIGRDITPTLTPLSFSLHNSNLNTHCSACFSPLSGPFPSIPNPPFYCSPPCSAALSPLHHSSAETHLPPSVHSSHLRAALRLLRSHRPSPSLRLAGLLSNHRILTSPQTPSLSHDDDHVSESIRLGAAAMAEAIAEQRAVPNGDAVLEEATIAFCAVLTNAVEVHDDEGRALGIAVFDPTFSWINHSCSPNACYRFILSSHSDEPELLGIAPHPQMGSGGVCVSSNEFAQEVLGYGPRLVVRSIKKIKKGEEVTVAYTDILQPKAMRQWELWSKYRFVCSCKRCRALPFSYVDHALQEISTFSYDSTGSYSKFLKDMADRKLSEGIDDVISEYLSVGDPESCCDKLEKILMQDVKGKSDSKFMLHPLNHHSIKAYTTLASAYKVCAGDLLSVDSEIDTNQLKAFDMSRTSAAYSLLLAGATHHLFNSESSLIASVANFWIGAGESLLFLSRSSEWSTCDTLGLIVPNLNSAIKFKWSKCSLVDRIRTCIANGQINSADFENVSNEFICCVSDITQKVWGFLISDCPFLRSCKDPINFSWLMSTKSSDTMDVEVCDNKSYKTEICYTHEPENSIYICEEPTSTDDVVACLLQLGLHCLAYGGLLGSICYGPQSHMVCRVLNVLDREKNFVLYSREES